MQLRLSSLHHRGEDQQIAVRSWGKGPHDVCLLHGMLAHSYWWSYVASSFSAPDRLMAPEFSGMGHSKWCDSYGLVLHAHEIASQIDSPMFVVGHSYGGMVGYVLSVLYPDKVKGLILIDSPLKAWMDIPPQVIGRSGHKLRAYTDLSDMKKSFVLLPAQPFPSSEVENDLFEHSYRQHEDEYRWLFDPRLMQYMGQFSGIHELQMHCSTPVCYIAGGRSRMSQPEDRIGLQYWAPQTTFLTIDDAYHAVLLDQPSALACMIETWMAKMDCA